MNDSLATIDHEISRFRGQGTQNSVACLAVAYGLLIIVLGILLGPSLIGRQRLAFRDVSHFYTPLYEYVAARQAEAWLPLWNPLDLNGLPLAGETTTAVFYPIRMLIYKLVPSSTVAIAWYVVTHLLIASVAIHIAATSAGASRFGCAVAVVVYPLAGPIFFLIYNPPYLVGAAWLPLAIAGGIHLLKQLSIRWIAITAISLAMPVLGGDPQTTIHVLLIGGITSLLHFAKSVRKDATMAVRSMIGLVASVLLGAAIAAPQLAASVDWGMQSGRLAGHVTSERYDFSVSPSHWLELIVSGVSGRLFPLNTRLSEALSGDERTWVVTLYAGIVAFIICIDRYLTQGLRRLDLWDWLIPIGLLFSMAWPYWVIVNTIPGYEAFRYPAKWLSIMSMGIAITAARHSDQCFAGNVRGIQSICIVVVVTSLTVAAISVAAEAMGAEKAIDSLQIVDRFWGPLRVDLALTSIVWSAMATAGVAIAFWLLMRRSEQQRSDLVACFAALAIISLDLFVSARSQIATVSTVAENQVLDLAIVDRIDIQPSQRGIQVSGPTMWPQQWRSRHDGEDRLLEVEISQRATQFGRWHLSAGNPIFNSAVSIVPQRIDMFWSAMDQMQFQGASERRECWSRVEQWLGIDSENRTTMLSVLAPMNRDLLVAVGNQSRNKLDTAFYRWDTRWRTSDPCKTVSAGEMRLRLAEIASGSSLSYPIVEDLGSHTHTDCGPAPTLKLLANEPDFSTFQVATQCVGLLTIKGFQDGHWHAKLCQVGSEQSKIIEPKRTDYLFMSVEIPAGDWRVTWFYWPWWLTASFAVSATATCLASVALLIRPVHNGCNEST